jgi:nucleoside-diphosphate-sugar epimerase
MECVELVGRDGDNLPIQTLRFGDLSLLVESYRVLQNIRQACRVVLPWTGHVLPLCRQAREYYTTEGGYKGSQARSFRYVDGLIDGLYRLMNAPDKVTGQINLGNPTELSIGKLAERIIKIGESSSHVEYGTLPAGDPMQRQPDIALAKQVLEWAPTVGPKRPAGYTDHGNSRRRAAMARLAGGAQNRP